MDKYHRQKEIAKGDSGLKISFLFGAGAEIGYNMPSGGKFALEIFRQDTTKAKESFKAARDQIDPTTNYAATWLPSDYKTRSIGTFGKSVFENIIKDTIEHNRDRIIANLNDFDNVASGIVEHMTENGLDVDESIRQLTGRNPDNISMLQSISYTDEFGDGNKLFGSNYFSALLLIYKEKLSASNRVSLGKIIRSILQLQIGALGERLSRKINENLFKQKDDAIDLFDDLGEIMQLDYRVSGVSGLEYLLETSRPEFNSYEDIIIYFAQELLEAIFASVLDYKTLIDTNWHYLYCPKAEWAKFCKISIFLYTVKEYIEVQCKQVDLSQGGYYDDLKEAINKQRIDANSIATTNYTGLISSVLGPSIYYLNGSTGKMYDPYINRIFGQSETPAENHFLVPLMFTQSGTKPMTSIGMSIDYVNVYNRCRESEAICSVGFGFNPDDEHINGIVRTLIDEGKHLIVVEPQNDAISYTTRAKQIAEKLKVSAPSRIKVIYVNRKNRCDSNGNSWIDLLVKVCSGKA